MDDFYVSDRLQAIPKIELSTLSIIRRCISWKLGNTLGDAPSTQNKLSKKFQDRLKRLIILIVLFISYDVN
jgi:hypothetical protein